MIKSDKPYNNSMNYTKKINYFSERAAKFRNGIVKRLTRNALPLFTKGGDILSFSSLSNGVYEPEITDFVNHLAENGFNDFFFDIGANIGLSSCQCGSNFKTIHMFEPNPQACSILSVNAEIALYGRDYHIHNFGLGSEDVMEDLHIPLSNWGGAFVRSADNSYSDEILAMKDGHQIFLARNYKTISVVMKSTRVVFKEIFQNLAIKDKVRAGVVKVDAEGYEKKIIEDVISVIPSGYATCIVFENWDSSLDIQIPSQPILEMKMYELKKEKKSVSFLPKWVNSIFNFLCGGYSVRLSPVE